MNCKNQCAPVDVGAPHQPNSTAGIIGYKTPTSFGWYGTQPIINELIHYNGVMEIGPTIHNNGLLSENGIIKKYNDHEYASIIPGQAFVINEDQIDVAPVHLVNTVNNGFRYISVDDNNGIVDLGGLVTPVIIGNAERPEALLIPLCNQKAHEDAKVILNEFNGITEYNTKEDNTPFKLIK